MELWWITIAASGLALFFGCFCSLDGPEPTPTCQFKFYIMSSQVEKYSL